MPAASRETWSELHADAREIADKSATIEGKRFGYFMMRLIETLRDGRPTTSMPEGHHR